VVVLQTAIHCNDQLLEIIKHIRKVIEKELSCSIANISKHYIIQHETIVTGKYKHWISNFFRAFLESEPNIEFKETCSREANTPLGSSRHLYWRSNLNSQCLGTKHPPRRLKRLNFPPTQKMVHLS
jgi:hypothetical protein